MTGQLFSIGQAVTPSSDPSGWFTLEDKISIQRPKMGEVYHVKGYTLHAGFWFITLEEINTPDQFQQEGFAPVDLVSDEVLAEALAEIFTEEEVMV